MWLAGAAVAAPDEPADDASPETWSVHGQFTNVTQRQPAFHSAFEGTNSLTANASQKETADVTLYLGRRLWDGAAFYVNPEIDQGFGLSNTLGVAGFPSGEAYKVGKFNPYFRLNRAFLRQTIGLGGGTETTEAGVNSLRGSVDASSLTFTLGKFSVTDIFDTNTYAHDPRGDFLNWSIIDAGAFDYAADAWGFTYGGAAEWKTGDWTLRGGVFAMSVFPNSPHIDKTFDQYAFIGEVERRFQFGGRPGDIKLLWYQNRGRMGSYDDAVRAAATDGSVPDLANVRRRGSKSGLAVNMEQEVVPDVGAFLRLSASEGSKEAFDFTEINRSVSGGVLLKGELWHAPGHTLGVAGAINGLSGPARRYFAAGGIGILIGDGQLVHYGSEQILETFYAVRFQRHLSIAADYQHILRPAYNGDRGPVNVYGLRLHADF